MLNLNTTGTWIFTLVKASLFNQPNENIKTMILPDWNDVYQEACAQAIAPIALQGLFDIPKDLKPNKEILSRWKRFTIGRVIQNEKLFSAQCVVIDLLKNNGINCAVLKGTSLSVYYPLPELRQLGDVDILINPEDCKRSVEVLCSAGYQKHDSDHEFHIGFDKAGAYIELHFAVTDILQNEAGGNIHNVMYSAVDESVSTSLRDIEFPVLSIYHQATALLLHMERHMLESGIGLRQLCDWAMFVNQINDEIWINKIDPLLKKIGLLRFAQVITKTCVLYLGLDISKCNWCKNTEESTCDAFIADLLHSGNLGNKSSLEQRTSLLLVSGEEKIQKSTYKNISTIRVAIRNLNSLAKNNFPVCQQVPCLLPIMWIYLPLRYFVRMIMGKRPKQSVIKILTAASEKNDLYKQLRIFKVEK